MKREHSDLKELLPSLWKGSTPKILISTAKGLHHSILNLCQQNEVNREKLLTSQCPVKIYAIKYIELYVSYMHIISCKTHTNLSEHTGCT